MQQHNTHKTLPLMVTIRSLATGVSSQECVYDIDQENFKVKALMHALKLIRKVVEVIVQKRKLPFFLE